MTAVDRRDAIKLLAGAGAAVAAGCADSAAPAAAAAGEPAAAAAPAANQPQEPPMQSAAENPQAAAGGDPVQQVMRLGFPWTTLDPFLFCVHHDDAYPEGNDRFGPDPKLLAGRNIGSDFEIRDGWRMYHGDVVPGFPRHPHRGFETVTVVRRGRLDHADSMGAAARYGGGDVQWMTAGKGINHAEMFPLLKKDEPNPVELFQIWLNLPAANKMVEPYFTMLWNEKIPDYELKDEAGRKVRLTTIAGRYGDKPIPAPPPDSWASRTEADIAIWTLKLDPGATFTLPAAETGSNRMVYFFVGKSLRIGDREIPPYHGAELRADLPAVLTAGPETVELLMLQGRPIGEPVAKHGPFVMNTTEEIRQAYDDYRRTGFGGWPWKRDDPVHSRDEDRFARHADGRKESPV